MTVCNQNRVDCRKLEERKKFCEEWKKSEEENHNQTLFNKSIEALKTSAEYTICNKQSVSEQNKSVIEYLFDHGKCGDICWNGKKHY